MKRPLIPCLLLALAACSKNERESDDKTAPVVELTSPGNNQQFTAGQTIAISGTITDDVKISELHVHISNKETGALLIDIHRYPGVATYPLSESFQAQAGIGYRIQVIAKDNSANEGRTTVEISTN